MLPPSATFVALCVALVGCCLLHGAGASGDRRVGYGDNGFLTLPMLENLGLNLKRPPSAAGNQARAFKYYSYSAIVREIKALEKAFPHLVQVFDAQSRYGLKSPGSCGPTPCRQYIVRITNERTLPDPERPEVFFSGELHGNEVVGPTTLVEMAKLLTRAYKRGTKDHNPWLRRLVDTRSIYFVPTANALGYYQNKREENYVDPNRDFPIDKPSECMKTIAARAINELWREHLFQVSLTFHGGMQAIAFEWGTKTYHHSAVSPDDLAQLELGSSMSAYAGAFNEGRYPHNRLNDIVYPVRGGMEDWAYAGSWLKDGTSPCHPPSFGGYAAAKTQYNTAVLRAFNILIECSSPKKPSETTLGSTAQLLRPENGRGNGHVPRNLRLALFMADIVQPYIQWVEMIQRTNGDSDDSNTTTAVTLSWEVGGAMFVDSTHLEYVYKLGEEFDSPRTGRSLAFQGQTRWSGGGRFTGGNNTANAKTRAGKDIDFSSQDNIDDRELWPYIGAFQATILLPRNATLLNVTAVATVDQAWRTQNTHSVPANTVPQSHLVNARTLPSWNMENNGHRIVGRTRWYSETIMFQGFTKDTKQGGANETQDPNGQGKDDYEDEDEEMEQSRTNPSLDGQSSEGALSNIALLYHIFLGLTFCVGGVLTVRLLKLSKHDYKHLSQSDESPW